MQLWDDAGGRCSVNFPVELAGAPTSFLGMPRVLGRDPWADTTLYVLTSSNTLGQLRFSGGRWGFTTIWPKWNETSPW